eukprot:gene33304-43059_t
MEYLKPRFDTSLLAYLNFAIAEEELKMKTQQQSSDWLQFESRFNLLLDPLLVAVRFYEMAHTSWTSTTSTTPDSSDVDATTAASGDHTYIVSTSSPQPQKNLKSLPNSDATILAMKSLKKDVDSEVETQGQQLELRHRNPVLQSEIETMQELKRRSDRAGGLDTSADFLGGPSR